jgi:hypothetical protein
MNVHLPLRECTLLPLTLVASLLSTPLANLSAVRQSQDQQSAPTQPPQGAQPQAQPASSAQQPTPKPKKVWTNEDVITLRTPADTYQADKEAQEAAEAEAAAKEAAQAKLIKEAGLTMKLPHTVEETQQMIKTKEVDISGEENGLERLNNELPTTPADQMAVMQKEIDRVTADLRKDRVALEVLQNHLRKLNKAPTKEPSGSSGPPSS